MQILYKIKTAFYEYLQRLFSGRGVRLTTHLDLAPKLIRGAIPPLSIHLHGVVLS